MERLQRRKARARMEKKLAATVGTFLQSRDAPAQSQKSLGRRQLRKLGLIPKPETVPYRSGLLAGTHFRVGAWAEWYHERFGKRA